jgi:hypothetical protein
MRRPRRTTVTRAAAVAITALLAVTFTVSAAAAKEISNEKYAKTLCGRLTSIQTAAEQSGQGISTTAEANPAQYQQQAVAAVDALIAKIEATQKKLKKLSPEDGGKKITKLFDQFLTKYGDAFQQARDDFAGVDPTNPAFSADVAAFGAALSTTGVTAGDPFSNLSDSQDLLGALGDEPACSKIVTVTGG